MSMKDSERNRLSALPFKRMIPNIVTLLALSAGMTSIRFTMQENWKASVLAIILAGVLDGIDGRVARLLRGASKFGAELDSLSDFISFGVAPAFLVFSWALEGVPGGWTLSVVYAMCCGLRLARLNTMLDEVPQPLRWRPFFVGLPAPGGAGIVMIPIMFSFVLPDLGLRLSLVMMPLLLLAAMLMVSRVPTFSLKNMKLSPGFVVPVFIVVALFAGSVATHPWFAFGGVTLLYLLSIPLSTALFLRRGKTEKAGKEKS